MKKYECPYCHEKSFSFFQKLIAGGMTSKGVVCKNCGKHCVHGLKSTIFNSIIMGIALIYIIVVKATDFGSVTSAIIVFLAAVVIGRLFNAFACELEKNNRNDL